MEHLLSAWAKITQQLKSASHILLLTDYDGTLTPIMERPELANLSEDTRRLLEALSQQRQFSLAIISGRALADLKDKVSISGIIYAGNHGLEIEGRGISFINPLAEELRPILRIIHYVLNRALGTIRGIIVEDKGLTLSVHYRRVTESKTKEVKSIVERFVGGAEAVGKVRVTTGKKVYEVRPAVDWDKGKVVKLLMKKYGKGGRRSGLLPIYLGDDLTDEDAFRVIEDYGIGISAFVGDAGQNTAARYFLESPIEVTKFLGMLLDQSRGGFR